MLPFQVTPILPSDIEDLIINYFDTFNKEATTLMILICTTNESISICKPILNCYNGFICSVLINNNALDRTARLINRICSLKSPQENMQHSISDIFHETTVPSDKMRLFCMHRNQQYVTLCTKLDGVLAKVDSEIFGNKIIGLLRTLQIQFTLTVLRGSYIIIVQS